MLALAGRGRQCPCCGARWRRFATFNGREDALCLRCGSLERHRALVLFLRSEGLPRPGESVLHFAPEPSIARALAADPSYVSVDIEPGLADVAADISDLPFEDESFGLIVCSHVLEHVADDAGALAELRRVCAPGGRVLVMVPRDPGVPTDEDPTLADPAERRRRFLQEDHVRLYGSDLESRLEAAGFAVEVRVPALESGPDGARLYGLRRGDEVFALSPR